MLRSVTGVAFICRFWFLHRPAAAAKILLHADRGGFAADASGQRDLFCNPLRHGSDLFKCSVASGDRSMLVGKSYRYGQLRLRGRH